MSQLLSFLRYEHLLYVWKLLVTAQNYPPEEMIKSLAECHNFASKSTINFFLSAATELNIKTFDHIWQQNKLLKFERRNVRSVWMNSSFEACKRMVQIKTFNFFLEGDSSMLVGGQPCASKLAVQKR